MFLNYKEHADALDLNFQNKDSQFEKLTSKKFEKLCSFYSLVRSQAFSIKLENENQKIIIPQLNEIDEKVIYESFISLFSYIHAIFESNSNCSNVLIAYNIIHLISNTKSFYSIIQVLQIIEYFLSRLPILPNKQISKLSLNPILNILSFNYQKADCRQIIQNHFPLPTIVAISKHIKKSTTNWLEYLSIYSSFEHSQEDSLIIFHEITQKMDDFYTNYEFSDFLDILINLINNQTLPLELFYEFNYPQYLKNLILIKNKNTDLIQRVLYLVGLIFIHSHQNINEFDIDSLLFIFHSYKYNQQIMIIVLWGISTFLNENVCDFLIDNGFLNEIVDVYQNGEIKCKGEIALFIVDLMWMSTNSPQLFLSAEILSILIDSISIEDENAILKTVTALYQMIEDCQLEDIEFVENVKQVLIDLNFLDIIDQLNDSRIDEIFGYAQKFHVLLNENDS